MGHRIYSLSSLPRCKRIELTVKRHISVTELHRVPSSPELWGPVFLHNCVYDGVENEGCTIDRKTLSIFFGTHAQAWEEMGIGGWGMRCLQ